MLYYWTVLLKLWDVFLRLSVTSAHLILEENRCATVTLRRENTSHNFTRARLQQKIVYFVVLLWILKKVAYFVVLLWILQKVWYFVVLLWILQQKVVYVVVLLWMLQMTTKWALPRRSKDRKLIKSTFSVRATSILKGHFQMVEFGSPAGVSKGL